MSIKGGETMKKLNKLGLICVVVMLISVLAITASFSWLTRPNGEVKANSMKLSSASAVVKSEKCSVITYACTLDNGKIIQGDEVTTTGSYSISAGGSQYFRSQVTNNDSVPNNISLANLNLSGAVSTQIINLSPLKTTSAYSNGMYITKHLTVDANSTLNVEWYIYNSGSSDITVTFANLPEISYYG